MAVGERLAFARGRFRHGWRGGRGGGDGGARREGGVVVVVVGVDVVEGVEGARDDMGCA